MICTATGFYYSGSSAVVDLVQECRGVYLNDKLELRFAYDPDGISDLEYNLVNNPNRHSGTTAIKRFKKAMEKLDHVYCFKRYAKTIDPNFLRHTNDYLKDIIQLAYPGYYHYDVWEKSKVFYLANGIVKKLGLFRGTLLPRDEKNYFGVMDEELFIKATKKYTKAVVNGFNKNRCTKIFCDQLVPASNFARYSRYFDNLKVIVVDRDPRDVYITCQNATKDRVIPKNIDSFCRWFRIVHQMCFREMLPVNVLKIQFEDLIYSYSSTVAKILDFCEIDKRDHVKEKQKFDPAVSQQNTKLWIRHAEYKNKADYIKKELKEYCYHFPDISK